MLTLQLYFAQRLVVRHSAVIAMRYMDTTADLRHLAVTVFYVVRRVTVPELTGSGTGGGGGGGGLVAIASITIFGSRRVHGDRACEHFVNRPVSPNFAETI